MSNRPVPVRQGQAGASPRVGWLARAGIGLRALLRSAPASDTPSPWRNVFESSPDLVFAKDLDGRYIAANMAFCAFAGIPRKALLRMRDTDFPGEIGLHARIARERVVSTRAALQIDLEMRHQKTRERRTYNALVTPLMRDGQVVGVACFGRDVTERIRVEKELRDARTAAAEATASMSHFLDITSQDLRRPLQSAMLFAAGLEESVVGEPGKRSFSDLTASLESMKALLDHMLDLARLESGTMPMLISNVPLGPLLDELRAAWEPVARAKGLTMEVIGLPVLVTTDPVLLGRMMRNLVENAVRYTEHGSVVVECLSGPGGGVRLVVRDTGPGIPTDKLDVIWDEFRQLHSTHHGHNTGLGLGLSIVRHLSRLLDHPVDVVSRLGQGTTVAVSLPVHRDGPGEDGFGLIEGRPPQVEGPIPWGARIIVVENDSLVLLSLRILLEGWGAEVRDAADAAGAATAAVGFQPDVILSVPFGGDSLDAVNAVRAMAGRNVPAVIFTREAGGGAEAAAARAGLDFIEKPVSAAKLATVLDALLRRRPSPPR